MRPLLELLADGQEWRVRDTYDLLAKRFQLTEADFRGDRFRPHRCDLHRAMEAAHIHNVGLDDVDGAHRDHRLPCGEFAILLAARHINGERVGHLWVVASGLQAGDRVVVQGAQSVKDGGLVTPKPFILSKEGE